MRKINNKNVRKFVACLLVMTSFFICTNMVYATTSTDPLSVINNLTNFMHSLIKAIGVIILLWGIVNIGMSLKSHDPSQRANGFMTLAGGIIIMFAKEILDIITGG